MSSISLVHAAARMSEANDVLFALPSPASFTAGLAERKRATPPPQGWPKESARHRHRRVGRKKARDTAEGLIARAAAELYLHSQRRA